MLSVVFADFIFAALNLFCIYWLIKLHKGNSFDWIMVALNAGAAVFAITMGLEALREVLKG